MKIYLTLAMLLMMYPPYLLLELFVLVLLLFQELIEVFLKKTGAQLWIQHDFLGNQKLKKAPEYYD